MIAERTEVPKNKTDYLSSFEDFLKWEEASRDTIDVKRCYIDLAGDLVTGILLSQIIFWFLPSKGKSRLWIEREGKQWLSKGRADWWEECRITPKQFDRSIKILRYKSLVKTKLFKFSGAPTLHVHLNLPALVERVKSILTKGENRYLQEVKIDIYQKPKTKDIDYRTKNTDRDIPHDSMHHEGGRCP
jgi:hypothetical protein